MDSAAVLTLMRMTTICNYNVQFPFPFSRGSFSCLPLLLWLHGCIVMRSC